MYCRSEIESRTEIFIEDYCKKLHIEAVTMSDMTKALILPAITTYMKELANTAIDLGALGVGGDTTVLSRLNERYEEIVRKADVLDEHIKALDELPNGLNKAKYYRDEVIPAMNDLRNSADEAELLTAKKYCPMPTYADLLFSEN